MLHNVLCLMPRYEIHTLLLKHLHHKKSNYLDFSEEKVSVLGELWVAENPRRYI